MFLLRLPKSISIFASILGLTTVANLIAIESAHSFSVTFDNGGFESTSDGTSTGSGSPNSWSTIGDVYTTDTIDGISPISGSNQAIITTGYVEGNYAQPIGNRNDDSGFNFNQSFTNPVSADTNPDGDLLQEHFGFGSDAFSIDRNPLITGNPRTSKEGSGMFQNFTVTLDAGETGFVVSFDWAYLSNDGSTSSGGEQDFSFWSLGQINNDGSYTSAFSSTGNPSEAIQVLGSSTGSSSTAIPGDNDYVYNDLNYSNNGTEIFQVSGLTSGTYTYRVGYGVVDVDSGDRTSAMLIDNIEVTVPFEFSPSLGLILVITIWQINSLYHKFVSAMMNSNK